MKTLIYLALCFWITITYSCSSYENEDITPINNELKIKELQSFAKECGYTNLTVDVSTPLADEDIKFYKNLLVTNSKKQTRGYIDHHMYITEIYYNGGSYKLQFDYSLDNDTREVLEAYGGVYGSCTNYYNNSKTCEMYTLYSKPEFLSNDKFDIIIKAYYLTSIDGNYSSGYNKHRYRLVIAAGLNVKTKTPTYQIHEQGEGEWKPEP